VDSAHGGKRKGAGRKPVHPQLVKVPIGIKLPQWLADWSVKQEKSRAQLIEEALIEKHGLKPPEVNNGNKSAD
jgi:hypothetical protein